MSRELEIAKEIVGSIWRCKYRETEDKGVLLKSLNVINAEPEELVNDYEALIDILEKAVKEIRGDKK